MLLTNSKERVSANYVNHMSEESRSGSGTVPVLHPGLTDILGIYVV
jgi:hypothetical protein